MENSENITIFLFDGTTNGLILCTIGNWKGVVYKIPRTELEKCKERKHLKQSGVYFLFGKSDAEEKDVVYIGQARERKNGEGILYRLQEHVRNPDKDYWTEAIVFTNDDNSLGPTEICYLEHRFCSIAKEAKRYIVKNGNDPSPGNITEAKESELEKFIEYSKLIMGILGHKVFDKLNESTKIDSSSTSQSTLMASSDSIFSIEHKKDDEKKATGKRTSEGFVVLADSYIKENVSDGLSDGYKNLRRKHADLINKDWKLQEDILFSSPSAAAIFVLGRSANGFVEWKTADGKTLKEVENEKVKIE